MKKLLVFVCAVVALASCSKIEESLSGTKWENPSLGTIEFSSDSGFIWDWGAGTVFNGYYEYDYPNFYMEWYRGADSYSAEGYIYNDELFVKNNKGEASKFTRKKR